MSTRKKLILSALGFVAATTALALWQQAAPPNIKQLAHRVPQLDGCNFDLSWLSNHEVISESLERSPNPRPLRIIDLVTGKERPLPVTSLANHVGLVFDGGMYRNAPLPSPDGKWLLYEEGVHTENGKHRTGWLLVRSDGNEQRKLSAPITEKERYDRKTFWLPDSSGWYVFCCNYRGVSGRDESYKNWLEKYDFSGKRVSSQRINWEPEKILADGRFAYKGFLDTVLLCRSDSFHACDELPDQYEHPVASSVEDEALSYDTKSRFVIFTVQNKPIPEQDFWESLFNRHLPRAHREFWLISREGKQSRCLATDEVSNVPDGDSRWEVLSWSPDGKRVLLSRQAGHVGTHEVYQLELKP
ncbi:hypothetical protein [Armatimonas sp.]|uniref:hypothetical protein n=1 Tax=Armatimonas sp. TaxID=1872638 RepID=UPI00286BD4F8|nr:hypothetical protein [Armatimonas sp.]